ncbi:MAG: bifunctional 4-hydroxy-2-oxoglutarate aldolase/2-dehydro-3-deoxy-phosphogluconate aldolase [Anaerolineae bacterium]|nr:bifunctional 4-hydroxy-2-oxoglutarate aldolase/2-dehydro-3-deoxy-phosphogluconate aldolase [Anaerolineae bacterium]
MAQVSRMTVLNTLLETGLAPLFYHPDADIACRIVAACLAGGARCVEFTNRGVRAHAVFEQIARRFAEDRRLILGVGSIVEPGTAALYVQLGAQFVVGPLLNPDVARLCNRRKVAYLPGCATVSEISQAEELGVEICKVFPAGAAGGPAFIKSVRAPMPWSNLLPTGGVAPTEQGIAEWIDAGACAVGIGSKLIRKDWVADGNFAAITEAVAATLRWIQEARAK